MSRGTSSASGSTKYEAGAFYDEFQAADLLQQYEAKIAALERLGGRQAADLLQQYEAKIAALERLGGRQALEIEFLKGAQKNAAPPRSARVHPS